MRVLKTIIFYFLNFDKATNTMFTYLKSIKPVNNLVPAPIGPGRN